MSESKAYERQIGAPARTEPRGKFRDNEDQIGIILPAYRDYPTAARVISNRINPKTGKPLPRVNSAKQAAKFAAQVGVAL